VILKLKPSQYGFSLSVVVTYILLCMREQTVGLWVYL